MTGDELGHLPFKLWSRPGSFLADLRNISPRPCVPPGGSEEHGNNDFFFKTSTANNPLQQRFVESVFVAITPLHRTSRYYRKVAFLQQVAKLPCQVVANFGDLDARGAMVDQRDRRSFESPLLTSRLDVIDQDVGHSLIFRFLRIHEAGADSNFEIRPTRSQDLDALRHVFEDCRTRPEEQGGHMKTANALFELLDHERLEYLGRNAI